MSKADLRGSLVATLRYLLVSKGNIELQLEEARDKISSAMNQTDKEGMAPISIGEDTVWYEYLSSTFNKVKNDIDLVRSALSQLGVSNLEFLVSEIETEKKMNESQGEESNLDFFASRER